MSDTDALKKEIEELRLMLAKSQAINDHLKNELDDTKAQYHATIDELQVRLKASEDTNAELKHEIGEISAKSEAMIRDLKAQIADLMAKIKELGG